MRTTVYSFDYKRRLPQLASSGRSFVLGSAFVANARPLPTVSVSTAIRPDVVSVLTASAPNTLSVGFSPLPKPPGPATAADQVAFEMVGPPPPRPPVLTNSLVQGPTNDVVTPPLPPEPAALPAPPPGVAPGPGSPPSEPPVVVVAEPPQASRRYWFEAGLGFAAGLLLLRFVR